MTGNVLKGQYIVPLVKYAGKRSKNKGDIILSLSHR